MPGLRAKKSDKSRKTFEKYGKYSAKHIRIKLNDSKNHQNKKKDK